MFSRRGASRSPRPSRGDDIEAEIEISLEEAFSGTERSLGLNQGVACSDCGGTGFHSSGVCPTCGGRGVSFQERELKVKIPTGVADGSKIRLKGEGSPGRNGGPPGNLLLTVKLSPHPRYEIEGRDLYLDVPVPFYRASLGGKILVDTLKGKVDLKIPPNTSGGKSMRLKGLGIPGSGGKAGGDLYVRVRLTVPEQLTPEMKELMEQFEALDEAERAVVA